MRRPPWRTAAGVPGFTLIELLVDIAIIATLAAIVAPALFGNVGEARRNTARSQIQIFALALDAYRLDNDAFPTTEQGLEALRTIPVTGDAPTQLERAHTSDNWCRSIRGAARTSTSHRAWPIRTAYDLYTLGKDGKPGGDGEDADITSWNGPVQQ